VDSNAGLIEDKRDGGVAPAIHCDRQRKLAQAALSRLVRPGEVVYLPGSSGEPTAFMEQLCLAPDDTRDARILTTYVPGINELSVAKLHPSIEITGLFSQPGLTEAQSDRRFRALPMSYAGFVRHLQDQVDIDLAVVQVSEPDARGLCSLGPAVEFTPIALRKSRRRLALINRQTPRIPGSISVPLNDFDYFCEVDMPLPVYHPGADAETDAIARYIAPLVEDGCVLQAGLGKVPTALMHRLRDRRKLRLHSGMLSDGALVLSDAGALDRDFAHTTCVLVGSKDFYGRMIAFAPLRITGCEVTHDTRTLAELDRFVAVNSALEVDLFGQCNLEHSNGRAVSGAGGAPDFARASRLSRGGHSIVALHATHRHGSRIVPFLEPAAVTLPRFDVDYVVTEFGVATLRGASVHERAHALIEVAAPEFRDALSEAWRAIASRL